VQLLKPLFGYSSQKKVKIGKLTMSEGNHSCVAEHLLDIEQLEREFQEIGVIEIRLEAQILRLEENKEQGDRRPNGLRQHNPIFLIVLSVNLIFILEDIEKRL
jgi:hypothetical protein